MVTVTPLPDPTPDPTPDATTVPTRVPTTAPTAAPSPSPSPRPGQAFVKAAVWPDAAAFTLVATSLPVLLVEALSGPWLCLDDHCAPPPPVWQQYGVGLTMLTTGAALYALGAPLVHAARGAPLSALADVVLRVGAPFALGALGFGLGEVTSGCAFNGSSCQSGATGFLAVGGFMGGIVTAVAVDYRVLSREGESSDEPVLPATPRVSPTVALLPNHGASLGLGGAF
jgi:hypothetical protein